MFLVKIASKGTSIKGHFQNLQRRVGYRNTLNDFRFPMIHLYQRFLNACSSGQSNLINHRAWLKIIHNLLTDLFILMSEFSSNFFSENLCILGKLENVIYDFNNASHIFRFS